MVNELEQFTPVDYIEVKFEVPCWLPSSIRNTWKRLKDVSAETKNKDEDSCPITLNNKNNQGSSQKF